MKRKSILGIKLAVVAGCLVIAAFAVSTGTNEEADAAHHRATAVAVIHGTEGNDVSGTVKFVETGDGVEIEAHINGLSPGKHGFHIHEFGDLSAPDGTSAGGHFNPEGVDHGGPDDEVRHVGDLGNIEANSSGHGMYKRVDKVVKLSGDHSVIGRAIVIHAGEDDMESQPTGAAGARLAVGVIGVGKRM